MTIRQAQATEPVPLAEGIPELLELSDKRDAWLQRVLSAWAEGYHAGELAHAGDYDAGYHDGLLGRKHVQHEAVAALKLYMRRWMLRGEPRSRETFGRPHPGDYPGRGGAA